ncbi:immunoglobulin-like domain-containing protein [Clostridium sporogenes]|uniref:immunoglobulin-like domain-containing protein n=1 Tax=Clostridium sporogenes TaxID=1509 RepID=UPI0013D336B1|nr:immunoglobulin-like domain-containing protein [Clostridium sporogenes]NFP93269.1 hypothetical protein [Clostridium sporogenes]
MKSCISKRCRRKKKQFQITLRVGDSSVVKAEVDPKGVITVTANLKLPTTQDGCEVSWTSDKEAVVATNGTVTRPGSSEADDTVKLTAIIKKGTVTDTREFTVTVKKAE